MLCIKDMAGLLKPYAAKKLVSELKQEIGIPVLNVPLITWASEANPLTGLVFCADCGVRMYNHRKKSFPEKQDRGTDPTTGLYPFLRRKNTFPRGKVCVAVQFRPFRRFPVCGISLEMNSFYKLLTHRTPPLYPGISTPAVLRDRRTRSRRQSFYYDGKSGPAVRVSRFV